jgi:hypothetical protein
MTQQFVSASLTVALIGVTSVILTDLRALLVFVSTIVFSFITGRSSNLLDLVTVTLNLTTSYSNTLMKIQVTRVPKLF